MNILGDKRFIVTGVQNLKVGAVWMLMERWEGPICPAAHISGALVRAQHLVLCVRFHRYSQPPQEVVTIILPTFNNKGTVA